MHPIVRVADTPTLLAINTSSREHGHDYVMPEDLIARLKPDGFHVCWGTFPHEAPPTPLVLAEAGTAGAAPERISLDNGNPPENPPEDDPHLRSVWLLSVDGSDDPVEEFIIHLVHWDQLEALPAYVRPSDRQYPPA